MRRFQLLLLRFYRHIPFVQVLSSFLDFAGRFNPAGSQKSFELEATVKSYWFLACEETGSSIDLITVKRAASGAIGELM
jgi:hypothetical protein